MSAPQWARTPPGIAAIAAAILIAIGTIFRFLIAWNREFQVDEIEHVHAAYNVARGLVPYRDFIQGHTPLLHYLLVPFVRAEDPIWTFLASRVVMFAATILALLFVFLLARRLFGSAAAVAAVVLLGFNTTFAERGVEVRPDLWLGLGTVAALWLELRPHSKPRDSAWAALLAAMTALFTQKALFLCVALGAIWLAKAVRARRAAHVIAPSLVFPLPIALSFVPFLAAGAARDYLFWGFLHPFGVFSGQRPAPYVGRFSPLVPILAEARRNAAFDVLVIAGIAAMVAWAWRARALRFERIAFALSSAFLLASLWLNPYPFTYLHAGLLPMLAIPAGFAAAGVIRAISVRSRSLALAAAGVILAATTLWALPRMAAKADPTVRNYQLALLREVQTITAPGEAVFDFVGLYFRPDASWLYMATGIMIQRYHAGAYPPLIPQFERSQPVVVMANYRTMSLPPMEQTWLRERFVHYRGNLFVLGRAVAGPAGASQRFPVLRTRRFRWAGPQGALLVDGRPFEVGELRRGEHTLTLAAPVRDGVLIMDPPGRRYADAPPRRGFFAPFD